MLPVMRNHLGALHESAYGTSAVTQGKRSCLPNRTHTSGTVTRTSGSWVGSGVVPGVVAGESSQHPGFGHAHAGGANAGLHWFPIPCEKETNARGDERCHTYTYLCV